LVDDLCHDFDVVVASADSAMAVVTTAVDGERSGCLVGFHSQCSIEPRRYALWLSKANHTYPLALRAEVFAVHFLDRDQLELAELFGGLSGDEVDKFAAVDWHDGPGGVPLLLACGNRIVGRRLALHDDGSDHVCVVVEPLEAATTGRFEPLRLSEANQIDPGHEATER
jgi:flavin reductase (DIM6/NTAB) family NADH-FMN oxidoreductase RutF